MPAPAAVWRARGENVHKEALYELGQRIRLIVCDLDGTLLDSCKQISRASLAAIEKAREKGVFVTICSGRVHQMLYAYSRELDIRGPLVAANGAVVLDTRNGEMLYRKIIDPAAALPLLEFCEQNKMDYAALAESGNYFSSDSARIWRFEQYNRIAEAAGFPPARLYSFDGGHGQVLSDEIYKILIYELREERENAARGFIGGCGGLGLTSSEKGLLDVSAAGVSKGDAVRRLAAALDIPLQQVCVFGDYFNDISMMRAAGLSIAMGNAHQEVKEAALAVTTSNDEDGVARAIEEYIL